MGNKSSGTVLTAVASDHGGFELKNIVTAHLADRGIGVLDLGPESAGTVDYPDYAVKMAKCVQSGTARRGVLICGTGLGMSIAANRFKGIRAALCHDHFTASASRRHNDSNILVLGGRVLGTDLAVEILDTWLDTSFEGERHNRRIEKIDKLSS